MENKWIMSHKMVVVSLVLVCVIAVQEYQYHIAPVLEREEVKILACADIQCLIEHRAEEIYKEKQPLYFEMARTDAMSEYADKIITILNK